MHHNQNTNETSDTTSGCESVGPSYLDAEEMEETNLPESFSIIVGNKSVRKDFVEEYKSPDLENSKLGISSNSKLTYSLNSKSTNG